LPSTKDKIPLWIAPISSQTYVSAYNLLLDEAVQHSLPRRTNRIHQVTRWLSWRTQFGLAIQALNQTASLKANSLRLETPNMNTPVTG